MTSMRFLLSAYKTMVNLQLDAEVEAELSEEADVSLTAGPRSSLAVRVLGLAVQHLVTDNQTSRGPGVRGLVTRPT
jgi:hypothetical protein